MKITVLWKWLHYSEFNKQIIKHRNCHLNKDLEKFILKLRTFLNVIEFYWISKPRVQKNVIRILQKNIWLVFSLACLIFSTKIFEMKIVLKDLKSENNTKTIIVKPICLLMIRKIEETPMKTCFNKRFQKVKKKLGCKLC